MDTRLDTNKGRRPAISPDLAVLSASFFLIFMGAGAVQQYLVPYLKDATGRTDAECAWVLATIYLSFLVWRVVAAYTIRWLGDQMAIFLGQATYTLFVVVALFTHSYWVLLGAAVAWGWGASAMWIASSTQVLDASARSRYGTASGVFYAATNLGQLLGVLLLGWVKASFGWQALFATAAVISLAANAVALRVPRKYVPRERPALSRLFGVLRSPQSKLLAGILFVSSFGWGILLGGFSMLLKGQHQAAAIPAVTFGFYLARLVSSWYSGPISDRLGRRGVLVWGFAVAAAGMLVGVRTDLLWALFLAAAALGIQAGTVPVAAMALVGDTMEPSRRHLAFGAIYVWRDLGVAIAILAPQYIVHSMGGYAGCFGMFAGLFAVCSLISLGVEKTPATDG